MASSRFRSRFNQNQGVPNGIPVVDPWWLRLIKVASPTVSQAVRQRYMRDSASGQIPGTDDVTATKLQSQWRSAGTRQPHANPLSPLTARPQPMEAYPDQPGSRHNALSQTVRKDKRPQSITPRPAFYEDPRWNHFLRLRSSTGNPREDGLPATESVWPNFTPPQRITRLHRPGLTLMAGPSQYGETQNWSTVGGIVIAPPPASLSRQNNRNSARSIQGVLAQRSGTGRNRIPAVFTPRQVQ